MKFIKMHAHGDDFAVVDAPGQSNSVDSRISALDG
jgi:diaminopimelate epimerase